MNIRTDRTSDPRTRRNGVMRTVWPLAAVAIAIYLAFIASGVTGP